MDLRHRFDPNEFEDRKGLLQLDLANGSFGSGTDRVKFGLGQLRVKSIRSGTVSVWVKFGFGSSSGQSLAGRVWIRFD